MGLFRGVGGGGIGSGGVAVVRVGFGTFFLLFSGVVFIVQGGCLDTGFVDFFKLVDLVGVMACFLGLGAAGVRGVEHHLLVGAGGLSECRHGNKGHGTPSV